MSFEKTGSANEELSFEAKNAVLSNEWGALRQATGQLAIGDSNWLDLGIDSNYEFESEDPDYDEDLSFTGILNRLKKQGVTPDNHEVALSLQKVVDAKVARNDAIYGKKATEQEHADTKKGLNEAVKELRDTIEKYEPIVTGAY